MLGMSNEERVTKSNATALKRARILKCMSRKDLAPKLNVSYKAIGIILDLYKCSEPELDKFEISEQ